MNRRSMSAVLAAIACCATLAACGGTSDESVAAATSSSATTSSAATTSATAPTTAAPSTSSGPSRSPRGNIVKPLGEEGGARGVAFTVDAIQVDATCDAPGAGQPMNGHFIAVQMRMTIDPSVTDGFFLAAKNFAIVGPSGLTDTNVVGYGWECMRNRLSEQQLQPGKYQGSIVLDAAETAGSLIYMPHLGQTGGWEWQF
jgi:hypothetical protein